MNMGELWVIDLNISVAIDFSRDTYSGHRFIVLKRSVYDNVQSFTTILRAFLLIFSILITLFFEQKCQTKFQYIKLERIKALNRHSFDSLLRNLAIRFNALHCWEARLHNVEICLSKLSLSSICIPNNFTNPTD